MPHGVVHTFNNLGDQPSRMLMMIMTKPSGIEKFFERCADEFAKPSGPPEMARLAESGVNREFIHAGIALCGLANRV